MAIFAISDLHLSFKVNKPMNIFGTRWENHTEILKQNWNNLITDDDIVLMPGDSSWGTYLNECLEDFKFIESLPGRKIITKGNHDYWWETISKLNRFLLDNNIKTINFLHNSYIMYENIAICGTKGYPDNLTKADDERLYLRELSRLRLSLEKASKESPEKIIVMLHYPPDVKSDFSKVMEEFQTDICVYGHLHDKATANGFQGEHGNILYKLVSCDYLKFNPIKLDI